MNETQINSHWPHELVALGAAVLAEIDFTTATPRREDVLRFLMLDPRQLKVVIIGQDPYPTPGVACGRAFAVNLGTPLPGSLRNLFAEIKALKGRVSTKEDLAHWEAQGVLLLNVALTTEAGVVGAHKELWREFTAAVIKFLDTINPELIWVLWGKDAARSGANVRGRKIIEAHPSPLSAHLRTGKTFRELSMIDW